MTYVNPSAGQLSRHSCQQICYTCEGVSLRAREKCVISTSGLFVYIQLIQLQFLESLLLTEFVISFQCLLSSPFGLLTLATRRWRMWRLRQSDLIKTWHRFWNV